jgi:hypothetical protein
VPLANDFDFSCWSSGDAKMLFIPLAGEPASDCLARRMDLDQCCNSCVAEWVDGIETHDKDGMCEPAAAFESHQQRALLCQACVFASAWMNQQSNCDLPNKTWHDCCNAACKLLNPLGNEVTTSGNTVMT